MSGCWWPCCAPGTDYNVKYIDSDGATVWKLNALDGALIIHKVAISSDGLSLYVGTWKVAASGANLSWPCLAKYDLTSGTPEIVWQKTRQQMRDHALGDIEGAKVLSLAIDGDGNLIVGCGGRMLLKFDSDGVLLSRQFLGTSLFSFGIHSLAVDGSNNIYCGTDRWGPVGFGSNWYNLSRVTSSNVVDWNVSWNDAHVGSTTTYPGYTFSGLGNLSITTKTTLNLLFDGTHLYAGSYSDTSIASYSAMSKLVPGASGGSLHVWTSPPVTNRTAVDMGSVMGMFLDGSGNLLSAHRGTAALIPHRYLIQHRSAAGAFLNGYTDPDTPTATSDALGIAWDLGGGTPGHEYIIRGQTVERWNRPSGPSLREWEVDWTDTGPTNPSGPHCCVSHPTEGVIVGGHFTS